ncbi:MAG: hypothetical protein ACXWLD_09140 [Rhizomicrobium sp.]
MCDPLTGAAIGASAIGSLISGNEANSNAQAQQNARNAATQAELARSKVYGQQSRGEFDKSAALFAPGAQDASRAAATNDLGTLLTNNAPTAAQVGTITTASAPRVVGATENSKLGDVFARAAQNNSNLAALKGYDQNTFNTNLGMNQQGRNIDQIGDFAKTSAGVNQVEQRAAYTNAYKPPSGIGELLSFGGNIGANMAGRGNLKLPNFTGSMASPGLSLTNTGGLY